MLLEARENSLLHSFHTEPRGQQGPEALGRQRARLRVFAWGSVLTGAFS